MAHCNLLPLLSTLLFLLSLHGPLCCGASEYYVKSTKDTPCPPDINEPCHTLIEYAENASHYFKSAVNVAVFFLPGVHPLNQTFSVTNASNVSLQAVPDNESNVTILCNGGSFEFANSSNLTIKHLIFSQCGNRCRSYSCILDLIHCQYSSEGIGAEDVGSMKLNNITDLRIVGVTIERGWPILAKNILGHSEIADLTSYQFKSAHTWALSFFYDDSPFLITPTSNHLIIQDSVFLDSADGGAICVNTLQLANYTIEIDIARVSIGRLSPPSSDIRFYLAPASSVIRIKDSHLTNGTLTAITVQLAQISRPSSLMEGQVLNISGCEIKGYSYHALLIPDLGKNHFQVIIVDSIFATNNQPQASVVSISQTSITFVNTTFEENVSVSPIGVTSTISLNRANNVTFVNCSFHGNIGTPISAFDSTFHISGNTSFMNNIGERGGAMAFYGNSTLIFDNHTHILFQNNSAVVGGAIFVDRQYKLFDYNPIHLCFFSFTCAADITASVSLTFVNNTAQFGGNAIYGANLDNCRFQDSCHWRPAQFIHLASHNEPSEDLSKITSPPSRVCLCKNRKPDCASSIQSISPLPRYHYPGEKFTIPAVVVGDEFGTVSGSVYAQFLLLNRSRPAPQFGTLQETQKVGHSSCTDLEYSVLSENGSEIIVLTAGEIPVDTFADNDTLNLVISEFSRNGKIGSLLLIHPVYLNITLLQCPLGFTLASPPGECVCKQRMQENNITCNITDQTLHRSGTTWINASPANDGVIVAKYCPFYYCKSEEVAVKMENPDSQCELNHSDTLCGGCQPGLSLALGSLQCLPCSNRYLALLIPFAVAGIALVFFIKFLNLTVSKGTINGLTFYANIVGAIPSTFFPASAGNLLTVFIAWMNLDFGIETCFFDGLDAYWKTWLQFVFPAYIWAIIGIIIFLSRHSKLVMKIFGSNSADVLATLLLLSYTKLLRTIITVLSFSFLELPDGTRVAVWSLDGNIPYLSGKHIPLFLVALAVLLLLWLPFTTILLFWQLLQRMTHYKIVRLIVIKKKPFFDTYFGPLKGEHRYWIGVLLLVRGILLTTFAVSSSNITGVDLLSITTVTVVLLTYTANLPHKQQQRDSTIATVASSLSQKAFSGSCYNSWYLSLLESSFILNLAVLSAATLYTHSSGGNQAAVVYTSVGIVFAQFVGIVGIHAFFLLRKRWHRMTYKKKVDSNPQEYENTDEPIEGEHLQCVNYAKYRESVLGHED